MAAVCSVAVVGWSSTTFLAPSLNRAGAPGTAVYKGASHAESAPLPSMDASMTFAMAVVAGGSLAKAGARRARKQQMKAAVVEPILEPATEWMPMDYDESTVNALIAEGDKPKMAASAFYEESDKNDSVWNCAEDMVKEYAEETLANVIMKASRDKKETVPVTKDMMMLKALLSDFYEPTVSTEEFQNVWQQPAARDDEKAAAMCKVLKFESTVVPGFVKLMARKERLEQLHLVCNVYLQSLYEVQKIKAVYCKTAQPLSEQQVESIKKKLKVKLDAVDIKMVTLVDPNLVAGFVLEYDFLDEEKMYGPTQIFDATLLNQLQKAK